MIPEPTDEDFARDADSVYAEAWRLFQLGVGRKEPEALAWIRMTVALRAERDRLKAYTETFGTCENCDEWDDPTKEPPAWVVCFRCWNAAMLRAQKARESAEAERDRLAAENVELQKYIACRSVETFNDSPSMQREET